MGVPASGSVGVLTAKGDILVHEGENIERLAVGPKGSALVSDPTTATGLAYTAGPVSAPILQSDVIPVPAIPGVGPSVRDGQLFFEGGMFWVPQSASVNKLSFFLMFFDPMATITLGLYQAPGGGSGIATKIGSVSASPLFGFGFNEVSFMEGSVVIEQGFLYVLSGLGQGGPPPGMPYSIQTYSLSAYDLLNQNVVPDVRPVAFTTMLSTAVLPVTFDPRVSPAGEAIPSTLPVVPVIRMRHS